MTQPPQFTPGQRWYSDTEPELGLGILLEQDHRSLTIVYPASAEKRRYAKNNAPLTRIVFSSGDLVRRQPPESESAGAKPAEQQYTVLASRVHNGLVYYSVMEGDRELSFPETQLSHTLTLNRPLDRLYSGQIDSAPWFYLKQQALTLLGQTEGSGLLGLCSGRTDLIPHQLYIAAEVASRYAPRVMLADEVGLGKTIEAGMILQHQLISGLASRVLIIVPEPLLHQWLVEMLRRFNLRFTLMDEIRCAAQQETGDPNPFLSEQLLLCGENLFASQPQLTELAEAGEWDLCIIDEAHHLQPDSDGYQAVQRISAASKGLLLLTATPQQLGPQTQFALLQLLDAERFNSYSSFLQEQQHYQELAGLINRLLDDSQQLSRDDRQQLAFLLQQDKVTEADDIAALLAAEGALNAESTERVIRQLLDQHGTGRILFRNTRKSLSGFPGRQLHVYPLESVEPDITMPGSQQDAPPERIIEDSRSKWLVQFLQGTNEQLERNGKVLLICADDQQVIELEQYLRVRHGVRSSVFHRRMSLLERDRAAAYFAAGEQDSAQILLCSEIGSEGRNFQFCHHLVLFDLPCNPDLLEQRIGRLDRIGQQQTIHLHLPCPRGSAMEILYQWYHHALNAFEQVSPAAYRVYQDMKNELHTHLAESTADSPTFQSFLKQAAEHNRRITVELEQGRDRLLEINSFNPERAANLQNRIEKFERNYCAEDWLLQVLDTYGVFHDRHADGSYSVIPSEDMLLPRFPGLPAEGLQGSFSRTLSLKREDIQFLSWQHPLVRGAIDLTLDTHQGNAAVSVIDAAQHKDLASCSLVVETVFRLTVRAPRDLQLARYLPATGFHYTLGIRAGTTSTEVPPGLETQEQAGQALRTIVDLSTHSREIQAAVRFVDKHQAVGLIKNQQQALQSLVDAAQQLAGQQKDKSVKLALKQMLETQTGEIKRLLALQQRNPNIRQSEIDYLKQQTLGLHQSLSQADLELMAVHVIVIDGQSRHEEFSAA